MGSRRMETSCFEMAIQQMLLLFAGFGQKNLGQRMAKKQEEGWCSAISSPSFCITIHKSGGWNFKIRIERPDFQKIGGFLAATFPIGLSLGSRTSIGGASR